MKEQLLMKLEQYQKDMEGLTQSINQKEQELMQQRQQAQQIQGAYMAIVTLMQENGFIDEEGNFVQDEVAEPTEAVEAEVVSE